MQTEQMRHNKHQLDSMLLSLKSEVHIALRKRDWLANLHHSAPVVPVQTLAWAF